MRAGNDSFFAGKELAPVDTTQAFGVLVDLFGECIPALSVELSRTEYQGKPAWLVDLRASYHVVVPSRVFGHVGVRKSLELRSGRSPAPIPLQPPERECVKADARVNHVTPASLDESGHEEMHVQPASPV
jgi:hypothetical protein